MTHLQLSKTLSNHGHVQLLKEGLVFIVLITGAGLAKAKAVEKISKAITTFTADKYPLIEAMRNDDTFFCMILKPKQS